MKAILISAACMMSIFSYGQNKTSDHKTTGNSKVALGIKAGFNINNLDDNQEANTGSRVGLHAGVLAHIHLSPNIALQPEVSYSSQGAKYTTLGVEKIGYINVPILLQYMFEGGFRVETGPQVGFAATGNLTRYSGGETDIKYQLNKVDLSWAFGLGYLSSIGLGVDARYNLGLTNIANTAQHNVKNRVWQFGLFYQFMH